MRLSDYRISVKGDYLTLITSEHYLYHGLSKYYRQRKAFGYLAVDKDLILAQLNEQPRWKDRFQAAILGKKSFSGLRKVSCFFKAMVLSDSTPFRDHKCGSLPCLCFS